MAAGQFYRGKNLRLSFEGNTLYHATSCNLSIASDTEEIATKDTNGKLVIAGSYAGSITTDCLIADKEALATDKSDAFDIMQLQIDKTEVTFQFTTGNTGDRVISGTCIVTGSDITAEEAGIATGSFTLVTTGDIVIGLVP